MKVPEDAPEPREGRRPLPKGLKIAAIVTGVLVLLGVAFYLALPWIAETLIRRELPRVEEALGRGVDFEELELLDATHVRFHGFVIYEEDGETPFLEIETIAIALTGHPVFDDDVKVASIEVTGPTASITLAADGSTSIDDLVETLQELLETREKEDEKKDSKSRLSRYLKPFPPVHVTGGTLHIKDEVEGRPFTVERIEEAVLTVERTTEETPKLFAIEAEMQLSYHARNQPVEQRAVKLRGQIGKPTEKIAVNLDFIGGLSLDLAPFDMDASVFLDGIRVAMPHTLSLEDIAVIGPRGLNDPLLAAGSLELTLAHIPPDGFLDALADRDFERLRANLGLEKVHVEGLRAHLVMEEDGTPELYRIFPQLAKAASDGAPPEKGDALHDAMLLGARLGANKPPPPWIERLRRLLITREVSLAGAELRLEDRRPASRSITTLSEVSLRVRDQGSEGLDVSLSLGLNQQESGLVAVEVKLSESGAMEVSGSLREVGLELLEPLISAVQARAKQGDAGWIGHAASLLSMFSLSETRVSSDVLFKHERAGGDFELSGDLRVRNLNIKHPVLAKLPIELSLHSDFALGYEASEHRLKLERLVMRSGDARVEIEGKVEPAIVNLVSGVLELPRSKRQPTQLAMELRIPDQPAQALLESLPFALRNELEGFELEGTLGYTVSYDGELPMLSEGDLDIDVRTRGLRITRWPQGKDMRQLNRGFLHQVIDPNATMPHLVEVPPSLFAVQPRTPQAIERTGIAEDIGHLPVLMPEDIYDSYPDWVLLQDMNPYVIQMVSTTEDGSFFYHKGFSHFQLLKALEENIEAERFERGASTISMQLIKNLYLGRSKNLSRKLQEIMLTWLMESVMSVPKGRLMEIYLNLVEWGPEIYGVGQAARHYFGKRAADLTLAEAAFLASILPDPRGGHNHWVRGALPESRGITRLSRWYMDKMYDRKCEPEKLSKFERWHARRELPVPFEHRCPPRALYDAEALEVPRFYKPSPDESPYRPDLYFEDGTPKPVLDALPQPPTGP